MSSWNDDARLREWLNTQLSYMLQNKEIIKMGRVLYPHYNWSLSTLRRMLQRFKLSRYNYTIPVDAVEEAIKKELQGPGKHVGYRTMWFTVRGKYGLLVDREVVYLLMKKLDPLGLKNRQPGKKRPVGQKRKFTCGGPNSVWSVDSYDKMMGYRITTFPIAVNGCVDCYTRRIMWMHVDKGNSDPRLTASSYLNCVESEGVVPRAVRTDRGRENVLVHQCHTFLRQDHGDDLAGAKGVFIGPSTANQAIERFWNNFRHNVAEHYREDLRGSYDPSRDDHRFILALSYLPFVKRDVTSFIDRWNHHRIRKQKDIGRPTGNVNYLYTVDQSCGFSIDEEKLQFAKQKVSTPCSYYDEQLNTFCNSWNLDVTADAKSKYLNMIRSWENLCSQSAVLE